MTVATYDHQPPDMGAFDERDEKVLNYLGLNPNNPADRAAVMVCRAYDLDAVLKHVVVIPRGGVYITRDGLLHIAHRSGQLDGIVVEQEPTLVDGEWVAKVSVYRKDMRHPFTFPGRYSAQGANKQYAPEMALKAAEAHALRRAFSVAGLPTLDEQRPTEAAPAANQGSAAERMGAVLGDTAEQVPDEPADAPLLNTSSALAKAMYAGINQAGIDEAERLPFISNVIGREIGSTKEMTDDDARAVLRVLDERKADQ